MLLDRLQAYGSRDTLLQVSRQPRVWIADGYLSDAELRQILALAPAEDSEEARALRARKNETGFSFEMPVDRDPLLADLRDRLTQTIGVSNRLDGSFRFRRYHPNDGHPEHLDCYVISGASLVFTALMHLEEGAEGGETSFPHAEGGPLAVQARRGRLVLWANYTPEGTQDPASSHAGLALRSGAKTTLTWFIYAPLAAAAHTPGNGPFSPPDPRPGTRLFYINQRVPVETTRVVQAACQKRGVDFHEVDTNAFDFSCDSPLQPGDMLFRPAVSYAAVKVEQHLHVDGVATLHEHPEGLFFDTGASLSLFERAGVPVPRNIYCHTTSRSRLRRYAECLGGFPLVAKFPGGSGGVNVVKIESLEGLFSFVDYTINNGQRPYLCAFIPDAEHWRVVVVGDRAVAAYRNQVETDDFRTYDAEAPENYRFPEDAEIPRTAVRAVQALHIEFGGVDVLVHPSGRHYVLEANYPCYFATAQEAGGFDIAGAIVEHLQQKARRLHAEYVAGA